MRVTQFTFLVSTGLVSSEAAVLELDKRSAGTATVSLASPSGTPQQLGSSVLYGMPINEDGSASDQIAANFYTDIGFNYGRAGGAAWDDPNRGWAFGPSEYPYRFNATLSNYRTTRKFGAIFFLLPHDMWGIDKGPAPMPGDDGDWSQYDAFLDQLVFDIKDNDMTDGLEIDIWNEPDGSLYSPRPQPQYLDMWARTHAYFKSSQACHLQALPQHLDLALTIRCSTAGLSSSLGLQGSVQKRSLGFTWDGPFGQIGDPIDFGVEEHPVFEDAITFTVTPRSNEEAYAFELF